VIAELTDHAEVAVLGDSCEVRTYNGVFLYSPISSHDTPAHEHVTNVQLYSVKRFVPVRGQQIPTLPRQAALITGQ
jgi:hypothetical protein